jgi:D-aminopeptidase
VPEERKRLRDLGLRVGRFPAGPLNALVDVPGVGVGHRTLIAGESVRTGVTAVLPHGENLYEEKVLGGWHVLNGYGKATGLTQLEELGTLESPILLTSTLSVGAVWEGGVRHTLAQNPEAGRDRDTVNVLVAECFDGWLNEARGLHVRPDHAVEAIEAANEREASEGSVGAGTGTTCFGFKAGVGNASRVTEGGSTLGCLVVTNFGSRRELHMLLGRSGPAGDGPESWGGSAVVVVGTDAPLSERQLRRLAGRASLGLARAGSFAANASGEYAIAFSTAQRLPHRSESSTYELRLLRDDSREMRQLFEMAVEAAQEAVIGSLCSAGPMEGRDGHRVEALGHDLLAQAPGVVSAG